MTAFAVLLLACQQRHSITNCAREHTTETDLKELGTSRTHTPYIHKDTYKHFILLTVHTAFVAIAFCQTVSIKIYLSIYLSIHPALRAHRVLEKNSAEADA